jgi:hypothetical protein
VTHHRCQGEFHPDKEGPSPTEAVPTSPLYTVPVLKIIVFVYDFILNAVMRGKWLRLLTLRVVMERDSKWCFWWRLPLSTAALISH